MGRGLSYVFAVIALLAGCGSDHEPVVPGQTILEVWAHAGQAAERSTLEAQVARFNRRRHDIAIRLTFIPERSYNAQVQASAIAGDLPDLLEFDGPYLYNYVWQQQLQPLDALLPAHLQADLLPSIRTQGTWHGGLYGVGTFDSGLALYGRRSLLRQAGLQTPPEHPHDALPVARFEQLLGALAAQDQDGAVLDLKLNYPDEWFSYAFSPWLQSAGGDLIDRATYRSAQGTLNGPASVGVMRRLQHWLRDGLVDPNVDDAAFVRGRVALSLAGHWEYRRYAQAWGDDLVLLPLPDFGKGERTGQGSWVWGVTRNCSDPRAAGAFLAFLLETDEVLTMTEANGAVPATLDAIAHSPAYREDGPLHLFAQQLQEGYSVPRPQTPAYPVISAAFRRAFADIRNGAPVQASLDRAAALIDRDIEDNQGYPFIDRP